MIRSNPLQNRIIVLLLLVIAFGSGCKKDSEKALLDPSTCLVKKQVQKNEYGSILATVSYEYDDQRRITIRTIEPASGLTWTYKYTYSTSQVVEAEHDYTGAMKYQVTYHLDDNGLAVTSSQSGKSVMGNSQYEYNADGYMIKNTFFSEGTTFYASWSWEITDGNITSHTSYQPHSGLGGTETYTYFTDKTNSAGNNNTGMMFFGKSSRNLVRSSTFTSDASSGSATYSYEFDSHQRMTKVIIQGTTLNTKAEEISYEYY